MLLLAGSLASAILPSSHHRCVCGGSVYVHVGGGGVRDYILAHLLFDCVCLRMLQGSSYLLLLLLYLLVVWVNTFTVKNLLFCAGFHLVSADYLHPY